jgi:hypothetical protein
MSINKKALIFLILGLLLGAALGYYFGYDHGWERAATDIMAESDVELDF